MLETVSQFNLPVMNTVEVILVLLMLQIDVRPIFIITDGQINLVFVLFRLQYHCCRLDELLYYETGLCFFYLT